MTDKQLAALKKYRPDIAEYSDDEIVRRFNFFIESSTNLLLDAFNNFVRDKRISEESIKILKECIVTEARIQVWWFFGSNYSLEKFYEDLHKAYRVYEHKVNKIDEQEFKELINEIENYTKTANPAHGLYWINEGHLPIKILGREFKDAGLKKPKRLKEIDKVLSYCFSYLDTKVKLEPVLKPLKVVNTLPTTKDPLQLSVTNNKRNSRIVNYSIESMFHNPKHAVICLNILKEIPNPVLDSSNNYIGRGKKGVFPLWIKVLRQFEQESLVKPLTDLEYKDILNATIPNLNLTNDASEFRKNYALVERGGYELDMKTILSQYSQSGKLGK